MWEKEAQASRNQDSELTERVSEFLKCCIRLLNDPSVSRKLIEFFIKWIAMLEVDTPISYPLPKWNMRHVMKNKSREEFKMKTQLGCYKMKDIVLDLGFDVNILLNKSWELMGRPKLI